MAELKIEKIQEKEKVEVLSQCGSGTSIYSANNCSTQAHPYGQIDREESGLLADYRVDKPSGLW